MDTFSGDKWKESPISFVTHCAMLTEHKVNLKEATTFKDADIPILFVNGSHYKSLNKAATVEFK